MARVHVVHWRADELAERLGRVRAAGHTAAGSSEERCANLRGLRTSPPDVLVVDLGRLPSLGRDVAQTMRTRKATRDVPIVFVDGATEKVERAKRDFPDDVFTTWAKIGDALRRAQRGRPKRAVRARSAAAASSGAGYSGTPLPRKLGVKPESVLMLLDAPDDLAARLVAEVPDAVTVRRQARGAADVIVLFCTTRGALAQRFGAAHRALADGGGLWLAWPKKSSGVATDLSDGFVREFGLASGLVDNKVCAVDEVWSGLRFMRRRR